MLSQHANVNFYSSIVCNCNYKSKGDHTNEIESGQLSDHDDINGIITLIVCACMLLFLSCFPSLIHLMASSVKFLPLHCMSTINLHFLNKVSQPKIFHIVTDYFFNIYGKETKKCSILSRFFMTKIAVVFEV